MGSFEISEGNITWSGKKKKKKTQATEYTPNCTPSREVAQNLTSTSSKWGLNREVQTAMLREKNRPECPEDNLKELR